jgi:hypothetical protein
MQIASVGLILPKKKDPHARPEDRRFQIRSKWRGWYGQTENLVTREIQIEPDIVRPNEAEDANCQVEAEKNVAATPPEASDHRLQERLLKNWNLLLGDLSGRFGPTHHIAPFGLRSAAEHKVFIEEAIVRRRL